MSWKIIATLLPINFLLSESESFNISRLFNKTSPLLILPGGQVRMPIITEAVTLLPDPLSPIIANVSPFFKSKFTDFTASKDPSLVSNETERLFTFNNDFFASLTFVTNVF